MGEHIFIVLEGVELEIYAFLVRAPTRSPFALQVAFICSGASYSQYEAVLGSMGMNPVPDYRFYDTIMLLEDHTEGQCEVAKQEMKKAPPDEIGSWQRAFTVADGA